MRLVRIVKKVKKKISAPPILSPKARRARIVIENCRMRPARPIPRPTHVAISFAFTEALRLASGDVQQAGEEAPPVEPAMGEFDQIFGVRHHAEDILLGVEDAGNVVKRTIR